MRSTRGELSQLPHKPGHMWISHRQPVGLQIPPPPPVELHRIKRILPPPITTNDVPQRNIHMSRRLTHSRCPREKERLFPHHIENRLHPQLFHRLPPSSSQRMLPRLDVPAHRQVQPSHPMEPQKHSPRPRIDQHHIRHQMRRRGSRFGPPENIVRRPQPLRSTCDMPPFDLIERLDPPDQLRDNSSSRTHTGERYARRPTAQTLARPGPEALASWNDLARTDFGTAGSVLHALQRVGFRRGTAGAARSGV